MKKVIYNKDETRVPVKMWLDNIEEGALQQAKNLANLPFAFKHIAIMPDCLTDDAEVLTSDGWKLIETLDTKDKIANFKPTNKKIFFKEPKNIIKREKRPLEKVFSFEFVGLNKTIKVSENHRMAYSAEMGVKAKDLPSNSSLQNYKYNGDGLEISNEYDISDELLCLIAWIVGDGNIKKSNKRKDGTFSSYNIRFGLTKERKIKRIEQLLVSLRINYSKSPSNKQTEISIKVKDSKKLIKDFVGYNKNYPFFFVNQLSKRQARLFIDEAIQVDGDYENHINFGSYTYNSKRQEDIDFLSALISINLGISCDNTRYTDGYKKIKMHKLSYHQHIVENPNGFHKSKVLKKEVEYNGNLVCITCDSGFFICRQNGMTFISGNCHTGYGMPIGGVLATSSGEVIPNAVGVDIGCGMGVVKTNFKSLREDELKKMMSIIRKTVPVGKNHHRVAPDEKWMPDIPGQDAMTLNNGVVGSQYDRARHQVGTLGGGNHFMEIQKGSDGFIWFMVHSGSRNVGYRTAKHYTEKAVELNEKYFSTVPKDLAFFPKDSQEHHDYWTEMEWCTIFAEANRKLMIQKMKEAAMEVTPSVSFSDYINKPHNFAAWENHFGSNVIVHRKGATRAREGELGMIPGSQGTASYIVKGKGNPESFHSCSHGAGRLMSRTAAQNNLDLEAEVKALDDKGVVHAIRSRKDLDEAPGSYKDITKVMENQKDLVEIVIELKPLAVIKG